jgi:putative methyltransferase
VARRNVYLCQVNHRFGDQAFLPYSVGMVQAYCAQFDEITDAFCFKEPIYLRVPVDALAGELDEPRVLGISCYSWNWRYGLALARATKARFPDCLIVLGGPQVPDRSENFFTAHAYVDLLVHGEGEVAFHDILRESLRPAPDYTGIPGLTVNVGQSRAAKTPPRERLNDLSRLPSPYLSGVFDPIVRRTAAWCASQETHRGCPYACTFCDWGSAVLSKVRPFPTERVLAELQWFADHEIDVLYNCDANYGLLGRDLLLTEELARLKARSGFPRQFRPAFAKNSDDRVFEIARVLARADLQKGITLSVQSMDDNCLDLVKRKNIRLANLSTLLRRYREEGIPTYSELILGLPGETLQSFKHGFQALLAAGQHDGCYVNLCQVLPNAEMGEPSSLIANQIRSVPMPMSLAYSTPSDDGLDETFDIVIETRWMSSDDWRRAFLFAWAVQTFHCLNLTQSIAVFLSNETDTRYDDFYDQLLAYAASSTGTLLNALYRDARDVAERVMVGASPEIVLPDYGPVVWLAEEAAFLHVMTAREQFYGEVGSFLRGLPAVARGGFSDDLLDDLIRYQNASLVDPFGAREPVVELAHDLDRYLRDAYGTRPAPPARKAVRLEFSNEAADSPGKEAFALAFVRYGRKSNKLHARLRDAGRDERPLAGGVDRARRDHALAARHRSAIQLLPGRGQP